jgi:hypothetical protein
MKELMGKVAVTVGAPMPKAIPLNVAGLVSAWQTFRFKLGGPEPLDLDVYFKVLDQAVDLINADFARYAHYIAAIAKDKISGNELDGRFIRYTHARRYLSELFDPAYDWMKERGFTDGRSNHESLVVS